MGHHSVKMVVSLIQSPAANTTHYYMHIRRYIIHARQPQPDTGPQSDNYYVEIPLPSPVLIWYMYIMYPVVCTCRQSTNK